MRLSSTAYEHTAAALQQTVPVKDVADNPSVSVRAGNVGCDHCRTHFQHLTDLRRGMHGNAVTGSQERTAHPPSIAACVN